jgi:hypothetical protein
MKRIIILFVLLTSTLFYAQSSGITYQAVLYNPSGEILPGNNNLNAVLSNKDICLRFSITDAQTSLEYQETQKVKTDEFGMVNLLVGSGSQIGGYATNFNTIVWNSSTKKLQVAIDVTGTCSNFIEVSDQNFSAVPFAYASKTAENVTGIVAIVNGGTGANTVSGAKTNLGLNNVDNTSDLNKPISTATQTALDTKAPLVSPALTGTPTVPTASAGDSSNQIANTAFVTSAITAAATPDASATVKGKLQLTGDLAGTADAPRVPGLVNKENTITAGTTSQYFRGDKTWQTLDKTVVGLSNADNTSDANKPVSTATQTALNIKEDSANKSTDTTLGFSDVLFPTQKAVKTYVDAQITSGVVDATNTTKGKIVLAGDLAGTADTPTIAANAITTTKIATGAVTDAKITSVSSSKITGSIPVTQVNGAVTKVNGVLPSGDGSVVIPFGMVRTGTLAARPIAGTTTNGDIYVVSGDSNTNNNGLTFISDGTNWNEVTPNQASLDARYLKLGGGTMSGNIIVPAGQFISIADAPASPIDAANKAYVDSRVTSGATPDATTTSLGKIQLAGDLRGTAEAPTVPGLVSKAPLDSPSLTGIPSAPTAVSGTSTTQIATTEFVTNALSASNSNARSGDLDMNGNAILNISNARMAQLAILDEEAHPFFNGNDTNAITILNRENNVTQFLDGRTGSPILAITNSVNETDVYGTPTVEEGKIGIGTTTPSEKLEVLGNIKADKFIKTGGTPSQFLKADGSVDSNTYLTTSSAAGAYETTIAAGTSSQYFRGDKTWQTLDKTVVGLGNVDNTSDVNKPISSATQAALDLKAPLASPTFTGDAKAVTATTGDSDTSLATTAFVSTAITNAATPVATTSSLGKIQLGGDLAGASSSATSPVISNNAITTAKIIDGAVTNAKIGETIAVENGGTGATSLTGYLKGNGTSAFTSVSTIPVADVDGAVRKVNGVVPDANGNVAVIIGRVFTGATVNPDMAASIMSASPPKQSSDIYVVASSGNPNNGRTFIYDGTTWLEVATDLSTTDSRYVNVAGDTMEGNLTIPTGTKIIITDAPTGSTDAVNKAYVDGLVTSSATPDATASVKGKIKLAGDLGGTADAPTVVTNAITSAKILDGTIITDDLAAASVTNSKIGETITVAKGGTGVATLTGYVKGTGTTAMTANPTIPVADVTGAQTIANLSTDITADTGSDTKYPSVKVVETAVASKVGGSGTTNYVPKFSAAKTLTDSSIFDDGTKVGIGTASPTTVLSVHGSANVDNANANTGTIANSLLFGNGTGEGIGSTRTGTTNLFGINFFTNYTLQMALTSTGRLGLGTSNPFTPLSNTSYNIFGSDGQGVNGFSWSTGVSGYTAAIYNSGNTASYNGLAVKVANNAATTYALDISRGTSQATAGTPLFDVLGNGNVGIGTASPASKLDVSAGITSVNSTINATGSINDFLQYNIQNTSTGTQAQSGYSATADNGSATTGFAWLGINNSGFNYPTAYNIGRANDVSFVGSGQDMYLANANNTKSIIFSTGRATTPFFNEQMRILNNGNVGIGTATPANKLEITQGTAGNSGLRFTNLTSSSTATTASSKVLGVNANGDVILTNIPGTQNIVDFSTATPTTSGVVFTPNTPADQSVVYQSTIDNSLWTYNGSTYVTYTAPSSTAWFTSGTTNDAGNSKISNIYRTGRVGIGTNNPVNNLDVVGGFNLRNTSGAAGSNYAMEFNTNANSPRIDWVYNGAYTGSFAGDADFFFRLQNSRVGAGGFRFMTNPSGTAVERMTILNNGNVGIGNINPTATLDVQSPLVGTFVTTARFLTPSNTTAGNSNVLNFGVTATTGNSADWRYVYQSNGAVTNRVDFGMSGYAAPMMSYLNSGNVGIGTTTPSSKLHIQGIQATLGANANATMLRMSRPTWSGFKWGSAAQFNLGTYDDGVNPVNSKSRLDLVLANVDEALSTTPTMTWLANGNVGINNTAPSAPLVVQGVTGTGSLKLIAPSVASGDNWWLGFGHGTTSTDANDRARIGVDIVSGGAGRLFFTTGAPGSQTRAMFIDESQRVGIGTSTPVSKLEVNGSATNTTAFNAAAGTTIDFSKSNLAYTTASPSAFTLTNLKDGGTYTLAVQGTTSGTASFTAVGFTFKSINNGTTIAGKDTLYTFVVMGTTVYVYMATGF